VQNLHNGVLLLVSCLDLRAQVFLHSSLEESGLVGRHDVLVTSYFEVSLIGVLTSLEVCNLLLMKGNFVTSL